MRLASRELVVSLAYLRTMVIMVSHALVARCIPRVRCGGCAIGRQPCVLAVVLLALSVAWSFELARSSLAFPLGQLDVLVW